MGKAKIVLGTLPEESSSDRESICNGCLLSGETVQKLSMTYINTRIFENTDYGVQK